MRSPTIRTLSHAILTLSVTGVAAVGMGACSDPIPLIPKGAFSLTFLDTGSDCSISGHNANVGTVGAEGEVELKTDGTDDAQVDCTVEPKGGAFEFKGLIRFKGQYISFLAPELRADSTIDNPSNAAVELLTVQTAKVYQGSACSIFFAPDTEQGVSNGKVRGTFVCPSVQAADSTCAVQLGHFAFADCLGAEEIED